MTESLDHFEPGGGDDRECQIAPGVRSIPMHHPTTGLDDRLAGRMTRTTIELSNVNFEKQNLQQ